MTIIIVCNKCGSQDLQQGKWGWCKCPNCGELEMYETHPMYIIPIIKKELSSEKETTGQKQNTTTERSVLL